MKETEVLRMMADIGPNAKKAVESWVNLQWAQFWLGTALAVFVIAFACVLIYVLCNDEQ